MPVLPFSRNIGPYNEEGKPQNKFDEAALEHDRLYGEAKSQEDIDKADDIFLSDYLGQTANGPIEQFHKALGVTGIGIKRGLSKAGILNHPGMKRRGNGGGGGPPNKRLPETQPDSQENFGGMDQADGPPDTENGSSGGEGGGGGMGSPSSLLIGGSNSWRVRKKTYQKVFYQHFKNVNTLTKLFQNKFGTDDVSKEFKVCHTAWFGLPIDFLCMYMNEFQLEKETSTACAWRITGGSVRLTDFTVLNDRVTTVGGAPDFITVPTNQPTAAIQSVPLQMHHFEGNQFHAGPSQPA